MTTRALETASLFPTDTPGAGEALCFDTPFRSQWRGFAPLADPVFLGDPRAPTPPTNDNDTSIATTAFVKAAMASSVAGVASWNGRQGTVVLTNADVVAVFDTMDMGTY